MDTAQNNSAVDNFSFYQYVSNYNKPTNDSYSDGPSQYAEFLFESFPEVAKTIAQAGGFVTSVLNVQTDINDQHVLFLGLSSNLVVKIVYADSGFGRVEQAELLQDNPTAPGFSGGILSLAYVNGFLFVGMGDRKIVTKSQFEWTAFLNSLWELSPSFDWTHKEDHLGGAVAIYNDKQKKWQHGIDASEAKGAVKSLHAFTLGGKTFAISYASLGELPQTVSKGFAIKHKNIGDAPVFYALPTASKVQVSRLHYVNEGVQLAMYCDEFEYWSHVNLFPTFWSELPFSIVVGGSAEQILYAAFENGTIKSLNLNNIGDVNKGWTDCCQFQKGAITSIHFDPYSGDLLIAANDAKVYTRNSDNILGEFDSPVQFISVDKINDDVFMVFVTAHNGIYVEKNYNSSRITTVEAPQTKWHSPAMYNEKVTAVKPTALSNLIAQEDGRILCFVGFSTADLKQVSFNTEDTNVCHSTFIKTYQHGTIDSIASTDHDYMTAHDGTLIFHDFDGNGYKQDNIAAYPADIQARWQNGNIELVAQVAQVVFHLYNGDYGNRNYDGQGSFTTQFSPELPDDALLTDVNWSLFAHNTPRTVID
ncbi:hypothetical protein CWB99_11350 [Pseudoalteromonas rubra]|uniref:Uncharacterized protein n=1 Tax=Pseudoalteromonas rubra TaxID=43658 RepID=A0A5S3WMN6_9GAMM|nr:hypothetical protein [Pseudoalteromonas rubra]TMP28502.1 hypothetical protein CWB99_11350 [Pseudoalteromonas rubra]TMP30469.1 hypothetical protein CWC00_16470 [Pseudoalteromonas rubra]